MNPRLATPRPTQTRPVAWALASLEAVALGSMASRLEDSRPPRALLTLGSRCPGGCLRRPDRQAAGTRARPGLRLTSLTGLL